MVVRLEAMTNPGEQGKISETVARVVTTFCERRQTANIASTRTLLGVATTFALLQEPQLSDTDLLTRLGMYSSLIEHEFDCYQDPYRLSIGAEVEVLHDKVFPMSTNRAYGVLGEILTGVGVVVKREGSEKTEFEFPPCNSPEMLNEMIMLFVDVGFIPSISQGFNNLHINVGIPQDENLRGTNRENEEEENYRAKLLTLLLAVGHSTPERIKNGGFVTPFELRKMSSNGDQTVPSIKFDHEGEPCERFELRCFKVLSRSGSLRLLKSVQILSLLLTNDSAANEIWEEDSWKIEGFFRANGISTETMQDLELRRHLAFLLKGQVRRKNRIIKNEAQRLLEEIEDDLSFQLLSA